MMHTVLARELGVREASVLRITFGLGYHADGANRVDEREE